MRISIVCCLLLASFGAVGAARAGVIVVDPAGGPGSALLKSAIAGAQDGDVILLRAGDYASPLDIFSMGNKSLTIVADTGGGEVACNGFWAPQIGAGKQLVLRGLNMGSFVSPFFSQVEVDQGPGLVWLEDCNVVGPHGANIANPFIVDTFLALPGSPALGAFGGVQVVVQGGSLTGGKGADGTGAPFIGTTTAGGPAIDLEQGSHVVVHDAAVAGGAGGDGVGATNGGLGGNGVTVTDNASARLLLLGSTLSGGAGGNNLTANPGTGGNGGIGLASTGASNQTWLRETAPVGGAAGLGGTGGVNGTAGLATSVLPGTLGTFNAPWRTLSLPAPLREGHMATFSLHGQPGDVVLIVFALSAAALPLPAHQGALVVDPASMGNPFTLLTLPTSDLDIPFVVPTLPAGLDALVFPVQSAFVDTQGHSTLGGASMFIWIDSSF